MNENHNDTECKPENGGIPCVVHCCCHSNPNYVGEDLGDLEDLVDDDDDHDEDDDDEDEDDDDSG